MAFPTAPPHPLRIGVAATLCALSLLAAPARAQAAPPVEPDAPSPLVLAQASTQPAPAKPSAESPEDAAITATVRAWAQAWAGQDVDRYLGFYAPAFKPEDGESRKAWENQRRSRVTTPRSIVVTVTDVDVTRPDDSHASVTFRQAYRSDRYQDEVGKTLEFVREGDRWLIVAEKAGPVPPKKEPAPEPTPKKKKAMPPDDGSLGALRVLSYLGQPLRAEIDIGVLRHGPQDDYSVRVAPADAYREAGVDLNPVLIGAQTSIEQQHGKPVFVLKTRNSVNEPFLVLLVELETKSGILTRKYTALLDPPTYIPPPPNDAVMGPTPAAKPAPEQVARPEPRPAPRARRVAPPAPSPKPAPTPPPAPPAGGAEYTVASGDTLARIASRRLYEGTTLDQMLLALYRTNAEAFINGDINLLRAGTVLKIPDRAEVASVDPAEAKERARALMAGKREPRGEVAAKPPTVSGREPKPAAAPSTAAEPEPKPRVKLSRAEPGKPVSPVTTAASADDVAARERELKEALSRVEELEKNVADLRALIQIRDAQIAQLEQRIKAAQSAPKPPVEAPKPPVEAPKPPVEAPKPPIEAPKPPVEAPKPPVEAPKPPVEAPKPPVEAPKPPVEAPKPAPTPPKPRPAPPPAPEPSLIDEYLGDPYMVGGLVGVFVLLVAYGAYAWRKKKRALRSQLTESLLGATAGGGAVPAAAGAEAAGAAAAAAGEDADPLEEADVYMTYGRDAQAEEILREAIQKGETRPVAYSMLLQIYAKRRDTEKFEATALKMRGLVAEEGPEWEKAMALGRSIDPGNSLYGQGAASEVAPGAETTEEHEVDFDLNAIAGGGQAEAEETAAPEATAGQPVDFNIDATLPGTQEPSEVDMTIDFDLSGVTSETEVAATPEAPAETTEEAPTAGAIDFDLGGVTTEMATVTNAAPPEEGGMPSLELNLDAEGEQAPAQETAPAAEVTPPAGDTGADLGLSLEPETGAAPAPAEAAPPAGAPDLSGISLDLSVTDSGGGGGGGDARLQEVATKLHLAKSFEEIGDHDAARELLEEVIKEGDAAQQAQAQQMLASLG
ncbi:MAG: FimV/HubP family polar landmark protein [Burkholderiales bacterium]